MIRLALVLAMSSLAGCYLSTLYGEGGDTSPADGDADGDADADMCIPACDGRECGPDPICGEDCGPGCEAGETCNTVGECVGIEPGRWVAISAGTFTMGSPDDELGRVPWGIRETLHEVTLTRDFEVLSAEVTQAEFEAVMGYNPSDFVSCGGDCPVEQVNWHEAAAYCNALSATAGLDQCYDCSGSGDDVECDPSGSYATPYDCPGYRLPTGAEWEYAARAGTVSATYNGDFDVDPWSCDFSAVLDPVAWHCGNSGVEYDGAADCSEWGGPRSCGPHQVGSRESNRWGLFDMLGNVWEWCHDVYQEELRSVAVTDPWGPGAGSSRVSRGGSWFSNARHSRAAFRYGSSPELHYNHIGFRPARTLGL